MSIIKNKSVFLLILIVIFSTKITFAQKCDKSLQFYETEGFTVNEIKIESPLRGILGTFRKSPKEYLQLPQISQQVGKNFKESAADQIGIELKTRIIADNTLSNSPVRVQFSAYKVSNCDANNKKLDLIYQFYIFQTVYYLTRTFEFNGDKNLTGNLPPANKESLLKKIDVQPYFGYDYKRKIFGGTKVNFEFNTNLIKNVSFEVSGSKNSREILAELSGEKKSDSGSVKFQKWQLNFKNSEIPSGFIKLKETIGSGQYYGATRAFTDNELIFRYGGRLENGTSDSTIPINQLTPNLVQKSNITSAKAFVGMSFKIKDHRFKASYGLQLSSIEGNKSLDYVKQIVDSGVSLNFRNLNAETNFSAGKINIFGKMPIGDRFFGGNKTSNFIESEDWQINANPLIRSFADKQLASATSTNQRGADSFVALNFTLSARVWRKPLIERQIWENPNQRGEFNDAIKTAEATGFSAGEEKLKNEYLRNLPEFKEFPNHISEMDKKLHEVRSLLNELSNQPQNANVKTILNELLDPNSLFKLEISEKTIARINEDYGEGKSIANDLEALIRPSTDPDLADEKTLIQDVNDRLKKLETEFRNQSNNQIAAKFNDFSTKLEETRVKMLDIYEKIESSPQTPIALAKAKQDLKYPRQLFRYFIKDSDWISAHPVFIFDAVKFNQTNSLTPSPWRIGTGGGIKFRITFIDLTAGYVWNINRKFGEKNGSVLFKFDVADIFK